MNVLCVYCFIRWIYWYYWHIARIKTYKMYLLLGKLNHFQPFLFCSFTNKGFFSSIPRGVFHQPVPRGYHFSLREEWGHPSLRRPCRTPTAKREDVECCGQCGHRGGRRSKTRRSRWQKRIYGWLGHNQTVFFFEASWEKTRKKMRLLFGGCRFCDGMWMNHAAKKTTYQDWRMEEGTPSWNKGKQLHSNEGNSLLQIHQVIIYSFTDPKMCFLGTSEGLTRLDDNGMYHGEFVFAVVSPSATRYQNWHCTSYLKWFEPGLGWWKLLLKASIDKWTA